MEFLAGQATPEPFRVPLRFLGQGGVGGHAANAGLLLHICRGRKTALFVKGQIQCQQQRPWLATRERLHPIQTPEEAFQRSGAIKP